MDNLKCEIVRDLLPNYIEKLTSDTTNEYMESHLSECDDCRKACEEMESQIASEKAPEVKEFGKFLKKIKTKYINFIFLLLGLAAILTCFIVDLAINLSLTWSLIVVGGILLLYMPGYVMIVEKKNRIFKTLLAITFLVYPFLYLLQYVLQKSFAVDSIWFYQCATPITAIYLVFVWIIYFVARVFKWNAFFDLAFAFLITIPANVQTNIIVGSMSGWGDFLKGFMQYGFGYLAAAIIFGILGCVYINKKK